MWVSPNLIYGHCMKIITKQLWHSSKLQSTLSTPHSQRATSWVLTCTSFSLEARDCESRWHAHFESNSKKTPQLSFSFTLQEFSTRNMKNKNMLLMTGTPGMTFGCYWDAETLYHDEVLENCKSTSATQEDLFK